MRSLSEIDTISKRASKSKGFSWGVAEEIGKCIKQLELFGLPGIKNLNQYLKIYDQNKFKQIKLITKSNISENKFYCPISSGIGFEAVSMSERFFLVSPYIEKDVHTK